MKTRLILPVIALPIILAACCGNSKCDSTEISTNNTINDSTTMYKNVSAEEISAIRKPLDLYVQAAIEGDSKVARPAFAEGATISHAENDSLICLPIQALFDYYDATGKQPASYELTDYNVAGDVANVTVESVFGDAKFTDMFALVIDGADWKIVSKIFQAK